MTLLKFILVLFISVSITSCSDEANEPPYRLTNANIVGSYNIESFSLNSDLSNEISPGVSATFSTAKFVGDTFQVDLELDANGTYTLSGQYRVITTITIVGGTNPTIPAAIINFSDSGTYSVNSLDNTIQFNSKSGNFLGATSLDPVYLDTSFNIVVFNENTFSIEQEAENTIDKIKTKTNSSISFVRK